MKLYNEAILIMAFGSLPIRAGKQFSASRKLGKGHQNVLVFCNGDPSQSAAFCLGENEGEQDIDNYLKCGAGKLGEEHKKFLVFSKGDPMTAAASISVPETAEEMEAANNYALLKELMDDITSEE